MNTAIHRQRFETRPIANDSPDWPLHMVLLVCVSAQEKQGLRRNSLDRCRDVEHCVS